MHWFYPFFKLKRKRIRKFLYSFKSWNSLEWVSEWVLFHFCKNLTKCFIIMICNNLCFFSYALLMICRYYVLCQNSLLIDCHRETCTSNWVQTVIFHWSFVRHVEQKLKCCISSHTNLVKGKICYQTLPFSLSKCSPEKQIIWHVGLVSQ